MPPKINLSPRPSGRIGIHGRAARRAASVGAIVHLYILAILALPLATVPAPAAAEGVAPIRVQGATTFNAEIMVPHQASIETASGGKLDVVASKSSWGLHALIEGRADVAMISAPLQSELPSAKKLRPDLSFDGLLEHKIASTRTGFAIHTSNPVTRLPIDSVSRILKGEIVNWKDVGGPDLPILVVAVKEGGGTVGAVRAQVIGDAALPSGAVRLESANHVLKVVAQEPGAIGIAQLGLIKKAKLHEIVTERTVEQPLSFVTLGPPVSAVARLIEVARAIAARDRD
jgi:phosphate transport system substrate-binding protein